MDYPFKKEPAFFPFVNAEVFFEAEANVENLDALELDLDAELDELLGLSATSVLSTTRSNPTEAKHQEVTSPVAV